MVIIKQPNNWIQATDKKYDSNLRESMPKLVDHEGRREEIARATWVVVQKRGTERLRLRDIADEVGFTTGVFSHYFRDKGSLLRYAFNLAYQRLYEKILSSNEFTDSGLEQFRNALVALVPDNRNPESVAFVSMCFGIRNLSDPILTADYKRKRSQYGRLLKSYIHDATASKEVSLQQITNDTLDLSFAVLDGVCIASLLNPSSSSRTRGIRIIDTMISELVYTSNRANSANSSIR